MTKKKSIVFVVISSKRVAEVWLQTGAMDRLCKEYNTHFIIHPSATHELPPNSQKIELTSQKVSWLSFIDTQFWLHSLYVLYRKKDYDESQSFKFMNSSRVSKWVHRWLSLRPFAFIIKFLDRSIFFRGNKKASALFQDYQPICVICPGSALDSYSHQIMRSATRQKIKTAMMVTHWDFFSKKGLLRASPDKVYVWGKNMLNQAVVQHGLDRDMISIIGTPHFEKYASISLLDKESSKKVMGLKDSYTFFLFAGVGLPYDEVALLDELNQYILKKKWTNIKIIYRRHPNAWGRSGKDASDVLNMESIIFDKETSQDNQQHYIDLLSAVDGVISPFSTMMLEAAVAGKPSLAIGFSDELNEFDFSQAKAFGHISPVVNDCWLSPCFEKTKFISMFNDFVSKNLSQSLMEGNRASVNSTVYMDDNSYADRLYKQIQSDFN